MFFYQPQYQPTLPQPVVYMAVYLYQHHFTIHILQQQTGQHIHPASSLSRGVILNYSGATTTISAGASGYDVPEVNYGRLIGPLSWNATPVTGVIYQLNMTYYRQRNNRTYSFTGEIEWNGYGSTKITLTNGNTIYAFPEAEQLTVAVSNIDEDITGDTYSITMEL